MNQPVFQALLRGLNIIGGGTLPVRLLKQICRTLLGTLRQGVQNGGGE